ncbi:hypothetical protein CRYUN_Cryun02cG0145500 [Craigia yunnanensis]
MNSLFSKPKSLLSSSSSKLIPFSSFSLSLTQNHHPSSSTSRTRRRVSARNCLNLSADAVTLKEGWLESLSCPLPDSGEGPTRTNADSSWVIGIDPDLSGTLALLKTDSSGCSALVFDLPLLPVRVGNRVRKRLDARSIVQLVRSLEAPIGTAAYIEQSLPFPKDGKQDHSRRIASILFPSLSDLLKRKKDHGRAAALLIAAYGKGMRMKVDP